jgi:N-terminal acetyltransferase B complex catalytic subunit
MAENSVSQLQGYLLGKVEGDKSEEKKHWHGHVTAVTVAPEFRRQGLARSLMDYLEEVTIKRHNGYFVDLFVRPSNTVAINMYKSLGYVVYRRVLGYYSGGADNDTEDAFDMRKSMPRDKDKVTMVPLDHPIHPHELEWH